MHISVNSVGLVSNDARLAISRIYKKKKEDNLAQMNSFEQARRKQEGLVV